MDNGNGPSAVCDMKYSGGNLGGAGGGATTAPPPSRKMTNFRMQMGGGVVGNLKVFFEI